MVDMLSTHSCCPAHIDDTGYLYQRMLSIDGNSIRYNGAIIDSDMAVAMIMGSSVSIYTNRDIDLYTPRIGPRSIIVAGSTIKVITIDSRMGYMIVEPDIMDMIEIPDHGEYDAIVGGDVPEYSGEFPSEESRHWAYPLMTDTWFGVPHGGRYPHYWYGLDDPTTRISDHPYNIYVRQDGRGLWTLSLYRSPGDTEFLVNGPILNVWMDSYEDVLEHIGY